MKTFLQCTGLVALACLLATCDAHGRGGFGGFRGGGGFGGFRGGGGFGAVGGGGFEAFRGGGGFGGYRGESFGSVSRGGLGGLNYSGSRTGTTYSGWRGGYGATSSFNRDWTGSRGGSVDISGERGAAVGPRGGVAAGGTRDVTATGPQGRTYSSDTQRGVAVGPYGRMVGGGSHTGTATGPRGTVTGDWHTAFAAGRMPTDFGLAHYSTFGVAGAGHTTAYWSHGYVTTHAGYVRTNFGYYNCFHPAWYTAHPGAWYAAGWAAGAAWTAATWPAIYGWWGIPATPVYYDYGNTIVYQDNNVYVNGDNVGTAEQYAQQATTLADAGQKAEAPPTEEWKALGVFALVQGEEKTSNNIFQLAVNKEGIIRGNYYDGLMDTTTPVYGSVDKKTQRAAWTIGKKNDRVFETGIYNLTKDETSVLVHFGTDRTQQWLMVRVQQQGDQKTVQK